MRHIIVFLLLRVHDVTTAHRVEDQAEESKWKPQDHGRQNRVTLPHIK